MGICAARALGQLTNQERKSDSMKDTLFFVIDVESVGLHGEAYAVAGGLYKASGERLSEFAFACPISLCAGTNDDRAWVADNTPMLKPTHCTPAGMRDDFWSRWMAAKKEGAVMVADCLWPVEANFLARCVQDYPATRNWEGPYPFMDVASVLFAAGMDPLKQYDRLPEELPVHDPKADVRQSARMLCKALDALRSFVVPGQSLAGLRFGLALAALKAGARVARAGWNGKGMWLALSCPRTREVAAEHFWSPQNAAFARENGGTATVLPSITMKTATGEILMGWLASQTDMLAEDWMVVGV